MRLSNFDFSVRLVLSAWLVSCLFWCRYWCHLRHFFPVKFLFLPIHPSLNPYLPLFVLPPVLYVHFFLAFTERQLSTLIPLPACLNLRRRLVLKNQGEDGRRGRDGSDGSRGVQVRWCHEWWNRWCHDGTNDVIVEWIRSWVRCTASLNMFAVCESVSLPSLKFARIIASFNSHLIFS